MTRMLLKPNKEIHRVASLIKKSDRYIINTTVKGDIPVTVDGKERRQNAGVNKDGVAGKSELAAAVGKSELDPMNALMDVEETLLTMANHDNELWAKLAEGKGNRGRRTALVLSSYGSI